MFVPLATAQAILRRLSGVSVAASTLWGWIQETGRRKAAGMPIGSGFVESAVKWLIQQRFKGVGRRWSEDGFNHLLLLRLAWANNRFDTLFSPSPNS